MIDIHTHVLPGIDDGSDSLTSSLEMLGQAVSAGTTHVICTPHLLDTGHRVTPNEVAQLVEELQGHANDTGIQIRLYPGAEVMLTHDLPERYKAGELPTLANSRYMLIEPPMHDLPSYIGPVLFDLLLMGVIPILAHPERNGVFLAKPAKLLDLVEKGVLVQSNAGSFTGMFGDDVKAYALQMVEAEQVHFLGSDGHSPRGRRLVLSKGCDVIRNELGIDVNGLVFDNPKAIVEDRDFTSPEPVPIKVKKTFWSRLFSSRR